MRIVNRSALVPFTAEAMFNLVKDVEAYPEFLPWCTQARLQSQDESELVASLTVGFGAMNSEFTTHNHFNAPDSMTMRLLEGPFSALEGRWGFEQFSDDGCEVTLRMEFDFSSAVKDALLGAVFEKICNELIDAFIKRAHDLYG